MIKTLSPALLLGASLLCLPALAEEPPPAGYDSQGRRDPFRPAGSGDSSRSCPADAGLLGLQADQVRLSRLMSTAAGPIAALASPTASGTLPARVGDRLCDGTIARIDYEARAVVLRIESDHPLRPWRERVLVLPGEDGR